MFQLLLRIKLKDKDFGPRRLALRQYCENTDLRLHHFFKGESGLYSIFLTGSKRNLLNFCESKKFASLTNELISASEITEITKS